MPKAGDIKYCDILGGRKTNAAFVYIPPSAFWMGDASIEGNPVHLVGVSKGFWIQQTALTEEQFKYLWDINTPGSPNSQQPKTDISWNDVSNVISDKPFRLLTEAEWELAARAGVGHKYLWSGSNVVNNVAWTKQNSNNRKQLVADLKSNNFGLHDLSGNVDTWCSDGYSRLASAPQLDPQGPASQSFRIYRGGNWNYTPNDAQVPFRDNTSPDYRSNDLGGRLVWEI